MQLKFLNKMNYGRPTPMRVPILDSLGFIIWTLLPPDDDLALLASAGAAHGPGQLGAELPSLGATRLGRDIRTCGFAIDILTNLLHLATLE